MSRSRYYNRVQLVEWATSSDDAALIALIAILASFALCLSVGCGVPSIFTEEEKAQMVRLHNREKKRHGGDQFALVSSNHIL